jgi:hypothetical protein
MFDEKEIIGVPTAGLAFFGNPAGNSRTIFSPDANTIDIDIIRGDERVAALVPRGGVSESLGALVKGARTEKFSSFSRSYPLAQEVGHVAADNLTTRLAGEPAVNSGVTQMMRFRHHATRIHNENMRKLIRLGEVLAWQSLMTGKQDAILGTTNTDLQYDFRRNALMTFTTGNAWSGGAATIMADLDTACGKARAIGHVTPDMAVFGSSAMSSFISNSLVATLADNRRFTYIAFGSGAVMPEKFARFVAGGMVFQGMLRTPQGYNLAVFTYPEVYTAANGTATPYIAADKVLITSSTARADRYFGPPEQLPMIPMRAQLYRELFGFDPYAPPMPANIKGGLSQGIPPQSCYAQAYVSPDWKRVMIETQCAPIFATTQTDAFAVLDVTP